MHHAVRRDSTRSSTTGNGLRSAVVLLFLSALLVGCGKKSESGSSGATIAAPTSNAADADVTSGCWTAADRKQSSTQPMQWTKPPAMIVDPAKHYTATLTTNKGSFVVEFYPGDAPQTVNNFVCLAKAGYYVNTPFHRIVQDFVIQGGDPTGTGGGGPGYQFADEPIKRNYELGTLAMANAGPNTNGSQFFVVVGPKGEALPQQYTIFGKVTSGMDVVNTIAQTPTKTSSSGEKSVPLEPVVLQDVTIAES
ncbi:MAG TPA: peptidylprolyl isomerase [Thermomicrobiales bacterium]|jgi:cyclophilin family peptidyl-prolyl cis-trans isomerase